MDYSIVIPTYNEKENLPIVVALIYEALATGYLAKDKWEILIVDDNSPDGTATVCEQLQKAFSDINLRLHRRPGKLGLGSAYMDALALVKGKFVILMDADLSHHPKFIPHMIETQKVYQADIVSGTRYSLGGGVHGWDFKRILISRTANFLAHLLLDPKCSDLTGSFRLYRREALSIIMKQMISRGYVFQMEVITRASRLNLKIVEVPISFVDRIYGESKLGPMEIVEYGKGLLKLFWEL
eukprot:Blabericola_migrator_1__2652@NODE_1752_length_3856_cov_389_225653_g1129_i0_p3_GENE_NODE_1752_length_3856_cov_389_225653_g1129_i0NODE_1752_length_3856_cov_389_225653_g1129_i0_p3_ORF_typecomplete_len240_score37_24Glycos_transf_2/PF00535_26/3_8e33Glyco_tranf_2_3/PF13641_6/2_6e20Glyco_transf_21/PF13506_6/2_7e03Glyco_transf_21/PF13506_6/0_0021Glyco_tranf_2_2/PF10111_9/0_006Glyco_tranf_2_4/PF13704_6/0_044CAP59_mtransfer/PF11735_8/0_27_NODE_1752_length_3856_cov_389_225653_g1129_i010311750